MKGFQMGHESRNISHIACEQVTQMKKTTTSTTATTTKTPYVWFLLLLLLTLLFMDVVGLGERGTKTGSTQQSPLEGHTWDAVNQTNVGTISKATLVETSERQVEQIWVFLSAAQVASCTELNLHSLPNTAASNTTELSVCCETNLLCVTSTSSDSLSRSTLAACRRVWYS